MTPQGEPRVGCGAAIHDNAGRLLLIQRLREPEAYCWGLPGGKVDFGEPAEEAVIREIAEELGVTIKLNRLVCIAETLDVGDGQHWIAPVYRATITAGSPCIMEPQKHGSWGWFTLDELPPRLTSPTGDYLAAIASASTS